jgi:transposase-like protein
MSLTRKQRVPEEKLRILEEAEKSGSTISEVCRQHGVSTGQFYQWKETLKKAALEAFKRDGKRKNSRVDLEKDKLREENERMKSVIAEITAENLDLKKKYFL